MENENALRIFTISAKSLDALNNLLKDYNNYLKKYKELNLSDICYTANTGRGHYSYRVALTVKNIDELKKKIEEIVILGLESINDVYYGYFKSVPANKEKKQEGEITEADIRDFSREVSSKLEEYILSNKENENILKNICKLYSQGADVDFEELYKNEKRNKVSLPVYPFG